ncbi:OLIGOPEPTIDE TRANSPORTER family protein [Dorcoceras hygrometricum]|uniref:OLIGOPEPTIDE TRANSPORTER family protein n=1 Tax=Dorcoceras hygrometricum TaxID=472368 RepID=A0A2Z7D295_9LAMI|nr:OLIGOPEPTIDE TRANSPORTER family protein [Dorcoceras hygrometricum]
MAAGRRRGRRQPPAAARTCARATSHVARDDQRAGRAWLRDEDGSQRPEIGFCASPCNHLHEAGCLRSAAASRSARGCRTRCGVRAAAAACFVAGGRRRMATVRRVPGNDAMADFLLGYVRACPGQPMKFSGRYSIPGRFWSILKF